jgi:broad specificity phosphatase PhoE
MGKLYLVRHGQASFGAANYDQLSPLGGQQCRALGDYFAARGQRFEAIYTGTLARQVQSQQAICAGLAAAGMALPEVQRLPGLNEYESAALIEAVAPEPLPKPDTPERVRQHFGLLRQGLLAWMAGQSQPRGMPSFADFAAGLADALAQARRQGAGDVLIVSSGGPISTAVGQSLGASAEATIALNMRIRNSALSEFTCSPQRHTLLTFNTLPHLDAPERADWVTYT